MADITAKIKLDGEAQFKSGMRDAANATKSLDSQLKLAEQDFKDTGDAQALMATRSDLLKQKLESQKGAVSAAKQALEQCKKQGLDPTSAKVVEWKGKLAEAETQVRETTREIANNEKGLDKAGKAYSTTSTKVSDMGDKADLAEDDVRSLNTSLKNVDKGITLQNVSDALDKINAGLNRGIAAAVRMAKKLWSLTSGATDWADDLATLSATSGIDPVTLQQWEYAAGLIDTDVDTIIKARNKIAMNAGKDSFTELLGGYGIESQGRDAYDVMWDVLDLLGQMDDATARDSLAMEIFGKSATDLIPLITAGRKAWDDTANEAPVVSEENLQKLTSANDAIVRMEANFEVLKTSLLAQLAPALETVANSLSQGMSTFSEYLETEEGKAKLEAFSKSIVGLAEKVMDIDWGKALEAAGAAMTTVVDALTWITDNQGVVIAALAAIAASKFFGTLASAAINITKLGSGLANLLGLGGGGGAGAAGAVGSAGAGAAGAAGGGGAAHALWSAATNPFVLGTTAGMALMLGGAYVVGKQNQYSRQVYDKDRYKDDPKLRVIEEAAFVLANGRGDNGANAASALSYLGLGLNNAKDWLDVFDYQDADRGQRNYLVDLLGGTNWQAGNDNQLIASIYRAFSSAFGEIGTALGDEALAMLPKEAQAALRYGQGVNRQLMASGAAMDDTSLYTYLSKFFEIHGIEPTTALKGGRSANEAAAAANGATTATWASADAVIARAAQNSVDLALTRLASLAASGEAGDPAAMAAMMASSLSQAKVVMDGKVVGTLVAPTVASMLARSLYER